MDERRKQELERDSERYRALLKVTTDPRSVAAIEQLVKKTMNRLDQIDKGEQCTHVENIAYIFEH
jgi:hypothetical protein